MQLLCYNRLYNRCAWTKICPGLQFYSQNKASKQFLGGELLFDAAQQLGNPQTRTDLQMHQQYCEVPEAIVEICVSSAKSQK